MLHNIFLLSSLSISPESQSTFHPLLGAIEGRGKPGAASISLPSQFLFLSTASPGYKRLDDHEESWKNQVPSPDAPSSSRLSLSPSLFLSPSSLTSQGSNGEKVSVDEASGLFLASVSPRTASQHLQLSLSPSPSSPTLTQLWEVGRKKLQVRRRGKKKKSNTLKLCSWLYFKTRNQNQGPPESIQLINDQKVQTHIQHTRPHSDFAPQVTDHFTHISERKSDI